MAKIVIGKRAGKKFIAFSLLAKRHENGMFHKDRNEVGDKILHWT